MSETARNAVSIIATVRNERDTIAAFVDSLLGQSLTPAEIVIVDGASTDGTTERLREYEARGQIRLISQDCNIAQGRNIGIGAATQPVIAVTDAGCKVDPHWLAHIMACFERDPGLDVVAGNFRFETHTPFEQAVVLGTFPPRRDDTEAARYYPSSRSVAFRRDAWARAGGYPEWLYAAEDTLFNIRLRQIGCRFEFARDAIVRWRPRETWKALARQRFNFARGNARVGIGLQGYQINLRAHALIVFCLLGSLAFWPLLFLGLALFTRHVRTRLWPQALAACGEDAGMRWRVVTVMEFVRLINIAGYLRGRLDRRQDRRFIDEQRRYMGFDCADDVPLPN